MKTSFAFLASLVVIAAALSACNRTDATFIEHLDDPQISQGMVLMTPYLPPHPVDTLNFEDGISSEPKWNLLTWNMENSLSKEIRTVKKSEVFFCDEVCTISRNRHREITMEASTSKVYQKARENALQPWVHFLLETSFSTPALLKDCKSLYLTYDMAITKCENKTGFAYNTELHAAQCLTYLFVHNYRKDSKDYMKGIWIGVGGYDNRLKGGLKTTDSVIWDLGTGTYIYSVPDTDVFGEIDFNDGQWHSGRVDVRKAIEGAVKTLSASSFFTDSSVDDFIVGYLNHGWEIPGIFDVCSRVRNFSIASCPSVQ